MSHRWDGGRGSPLPARTRMEEPETVLPQFHASAAALRRHSDGSHVSTRVHARRVDRHRRVAAAEWAPQRLTSRADRPTALHPRRNRQPRAHRPAAQPRRALHLCAWEARPSQAPLMHFVTCPTQCCHGGGHHSERWKPRSKIALIMVYPPSILAHWASCSLWVSNGSD